MSVHKPVELILTNVLYECLAHINSLPQQVQQTTSPEAYAELVARNMVVAVGQVASMEVVFKVLAALGGPAGVDQVHERVGAINDLAREQAKVSAP